MTKNLTVSTGAARPHKPASSVSQDAQAIAAGVGRAVGLAVHQSIVDSASMKDAKLRRIVEKHYGADVADGLAGNALAQLAKQCEEGTAPATNSQQTGAPDPAQYFGNAVD